MKELSLADELWREYDFNNRVYRIESPMALFLKEGGTTHRVLDSQGIIHCMPAPGQFGCVLRWMPRNINKPVTF